MERETLIREFLTIGRTQEEAEAHYNYCVALALELDRIRGEAE